MGEALLQLLAAIVEAALPKSNSQLRGVLVILALLVLAALVLLVLD